MPQENNTPTNAGYTNVSFSRQEPDEIKTVTETFFGGAEKSNPSTGLNYSEEAQADEVTDEEYKQVNEDYKTSLFDTLDVGTVVMDAKEQEEESSRQPFYTPDPERMATVDNSNFVTDARSTLDNKDKPDISEDELRQDPTFQQASQILSSFYKDRLPRGTNIRTKDAKQAEYGLQLGSEMLTNIAGISMMGESSQRSWGGLVPLVEQALESGDEDVLTSLEYVMEMYDRKDMSVKGWQRGIKHLFGDGSNFMLGGLVGKGVNAGLGNATKAIIKEKIRNKIATFAGKATAQGVATGGAYTFVDNLERQRLKVASGGQSEVNLDELALETGLGMLAGYGMVKVPEIATRSAKDFYKWLKDGNDKVKEMIDLSALPPEVVIKATQGDEEAQREVAGAIFDRNFERIIGENTSDELKPMMLEKLMENPNVIEDFAKSYGFDFKYFSSDPESMGNKVGDKEVEKPPVGNKKLKKEGYADGTIWVYDPTDTHGSFDDPEYTKAWRQVHELAHAITEKYMQDKYGDSRRFGAMSFDRMNPYDAGDPRKYKGLSLAEAQRAVEWEDVAFRTQVHLLEQLGINVDKKKAQDDWNIASSDTLVRSLTGDFSDPSELGVKAQGKNAKRIQTKDALQFLENQEKANAEFEGREATVGTAMDTWEPISDEELKRNIDTFKRTPPKDTTHVNKDTTFKGLLESGTQKELQAYMRNATPEERPQIIEKMKTFNKKPKAPKAREQILVQEDFNEQFYSKLEQVSDIAPDDKTFKDAQELKKYLSKQGVKDKEIMASGVLRSDIKGIEDLRYFLRSRPDKITKRVWDGDDANAGGMNEDEFQDWITVGHGVRSNDSDSGEATMVRSEYGFGEQYIETKYNDGIYVNDNGEEFEYTEMQEDWFENNVIESDEWYVNAKQKQIDEGDDWDELEYSEQRDYVIAEASDDTPWYDMYGTKTEYQVDHRRFDDYDDAEKYAKDMLYEDYQYNMENGDEGTSIFEDYTVNGGDNYRMNTYRLEDFDPQGKFEHEEPHMNYDTFPAENEETTNILLHSRVKERTDANGDEGTVVEELQSQWEQDWRKEGGENIKPTPEEIKAIEAEMKPFNEEYFRMDEEISVLRREANSIYTKMRADRIALDTEIADKYKPIIEPLEDELMLAMDKERAVREANVGAVGLEAKPELKVVLDDIERLEDEITRVSDSRRLEVSSNKELSDAKRKAGALDIEANQKQVARDEYYRANIKPLDDKIDPPVANTATPSMTDRKKYERVGMLDELLMASQDGRKFFGWNNSGLQNGSRTPDSKREGMKNAYDVEIPSIIQKETGKTPYKAYHDGREVAEADRVYWDNAKAQELGYDETDEWYWRIDLDDELSSKLNKSRMELYGMGGATLVGATSEDAEATYVSRPEAIKDADNKDVGRGFPRGFISDKDMKLNTEMMNNRRKGFESYKQQHSDATLGDAYKVKNSKMHGNELGSYLKHDKLFKHYPELKKVKVKFFEGEGDTVAKYVPSENSIYINPERSDENIESDLLHELQHSAQKVDVNDGNLKWSPTTQSLRDTFKKIPDDKLDEVKSAFSSMNVSKKDVEDILYAGSLIEAEAFKSEDVFKGDGISTDTSYENLKNDMINKLASTASRNIDGTVIMATLAFARGDTEDALKILKGEI